MSRHPILAVEDEAPMREFYRRFFEELYAKEFHGTVVANAEEALNEVNARPPELMIVDWRLPGISGVELIRALRAHPKTKGLGIIVVTGLGGAEATVRCLESGADDHVAKPVDETVLAARLRSLVRRRELTREQHQVYRFPGLELDVDANKLVIDGRTVRLAPKELDLMRLFLTRANALTPPGVLWDSVWGYETESWEHILFATVSRLRGKLGPKWGPRLACHRGRGYLFSP